jgi:PKD repeat protein
VVPSSGSLVAAYNFDQGSGTFLTDVSGNGNNGIISNAQWTSTGKYGGALSFNGSTNSLVTIPNASMLDFSQGMTLEAWVDPTSLQSPDNGVCAALSKEDLSAASGISYSLYAANGNGAPPAGHVLVNGSDQSAQAASALPLNQWTFLATTFNGSTLKMYVNGNLVSTQTVSGSITETNDPLTIGGDALGAMFTGQIDNVRIYNFAESGSAIRWDMNTAVTGKSSTQPTVTSVSPANGATNVSASTSVTATFNQQLDPNTVNTNTVKLLDPSGNVVPAAVSYNPSNRTVILTPNSSLNANTTYTFTMLGGSSGVKDYAGHQMASTFTSTFTTATPPPPTANAGPNESGNEGTGITFAGSASGGSGTLTYQWNFGDNSTASGTLTPTHTYNEAGTYTATLTVTDSLGRSSSSSDTVTVKDVTPTANAGGAYSANEGTAIAFTGSGTDSPADTSAGLQWSWTFGDSGTSTVQNPTHTYNEAGTYTATLTITNADGLTATSIATVTVSEVTPTANAGGPYSGTANTAIAFSGSATDSPADTTAGFQWSWTFGDGGTSTLQNPTYNYTTAGTYTVTLTVTDADGLTATSTTTASVSSSVPPPPPSGYIVTNYLKIPDFGANPTIVSVKSGNWSDPTVWSLGRTPIAGDVVDINPGTTVTYDVNDATDSVPLNTVEIKSTATLTFRTDINTQICVGNFLVLPGGTLQVGTAANPIAANVHANIDIANQALNTTLDPSQFGTGLIVLGNVTMHGTAKTPYATLSQEAHAGDTVLHFASPVTGWQVGDEIVVPDTQELSATGVTGPAYVPQWEQLTITSVSADGLTVTLSAPLQYNHLGAHDVQGNLQYLPQVTNIDRNIMVESQSFTGTRGYTLFTQNANVDVEYAGFCELGRTINATADNTTYDSSGNVTHIGTNQSDRYAMTVLDLIGPSTPQANGYQFTFIGNAVDNDGDGNPNSPTNIQWGLAVNNSYYGLIQNNVVWSVAGVGMGVEGGTASYNKFDGNFVANVTGTGRFSDQQLQGDGFYFGNPNNYVTNNIATDINGSGTLPFSYGFDVDASYVGTVTVAAYQGADPSVAGQGTSINMNDTALLQFAGNEVYGATPMGLTLWWIGTFGEDFYTNAPTSVVENFVAWNFCNKGLYSYPINNVVIDHMVLLDDVSQLSNPNSLVFGIMTGDYMARNLVIQNCNIQGTEQGILAPYMVGRVPQMNTTTIQNCYLDNTINIKIKAPFSTNGDNGLSPSTINISNITFAQPPQLPASWEYNIYMDSSSIDSVNVNIPQYVYVTNYNGIVGSNYQLFYTQTPSPTGPLPPNATTMQWIDGYVLPD